jgi:hypothetical protein
MHSETLEHSGDLGSIFFRHGDAKATVLESPDIELSLTTVFQNPVPANCQGNKS